VRTTCLRSLLQLSLETAPRCVFHSSLSWSPLSGHSLEPRSGKGLPKQMIFRLWYIAGSACRGQTSGVIVFSDEVLCRGRYCTSELVIGMNRFKRVELLVILLVCSNRLSPSAFKGKE
jgi:hypothetical protein